MAGGYRGILISIWVLAWDGDLERRVLAGNFLWVVLLNKYESEHCVVEIRVKDSIATVVCLLSESDWWLL